ncbi:MAG: hypothetical protein AMXMBFR12_02570 [Candidatus Babeliales bacterium]
MKKLLLILPLYFVASLQAECQSCNAPQARRTSRYTTKRSYQEVRGTRKSRQVVQPTIETRPARIQPQSDLEMIDIQEVVSEPARPTLQMISTPQAKAPQQAPQAKIAQANPKASAPSVNETEIVRPKIHEGINQVNYTASIGKSGALVHVVETKPVQATLSGKIIIPQVVDGQMQQTERALSEQEAQMYHQKIKAAAQAA